MEERILLSPPHQNGYEEVFVKQAFESNWLAPLGPNVDAFESEICEYVGTTSAVALSSGTAAIHLALKYFNVGVDDFVICSSLTFAGSCNPIIYQGARPIFIDSETNTWNMSPKALNDAMEWCENQGRLPKAVIIVNLYGQSADMDELIPICKRYDVPIIEDAAESLGAKYNNKQSGTFGAMGIFSFNGNKIITTSGGGMIVSNNESAIKKMQFWATQARESLPYYQHEEIGYNYRLSNVCAGIGRGQLITLNERISIRKNIFMRYKYALKDLPITMIPIFEKGEPNWWMSGFTINEECNIKPQDILLALERQNIEARHCWKPMHLQPVYQDCKFFSHLEEGSVSQNVFERGVCLPSGSAMTEQQQQRVIDVIRKVFESK